MEQQVTTTEKQTGAKVRAALYLTPKVETALVEYTRRHRDRFKTCSQAADHLLARALANPVDEGAESIIAPALISAIEGILRRERDTVRKETEEAVAKQTKQLGNRVAALLVNAGKDAHVGVRLCLNLLEYDLEDPESVKAYYEEAQLAAGKKYSRQGLDRSIEGDGRS